MDLKEGEILAGKYRIERVLGRGGMGIVVAATHLQLGERVALKFLLPEALENAEAVERFSREARAAAKIKGENVARVTDVAALENGTPYIVMEYLDGSDLAAWLHQRGPLPIEQAVQFVLQACEAIAEAHALGIVHRDLKPANLFVIERADGMLAVKVLDFGISKSTGFGSPQAAMTKTSASMGSPLYMSPEQMRSAKGVDERTDIWALGVVLHELLTGSLPFQADSMTELVLKVVTASPISLTDVRPGAPAALGKVILKCLEKDPGLRYPTIGALGVALLEFAPRHSRASVERINGILQRAGMSVSALELPPSSATAEPAKAQAAETFAPWDQSSAPSANRRRTLLGGAALLALPILALSGLAVHHALSASPALGKEVAAQSPLASARPQPDVSISSTASSDAPTDTAAPVAVATTAPVAVLPTSALLVHSLASGAVRGLALAHSKPSATRPDVTPVVVEPAARAAVGLQPKASPAPVDVNPLIMKPKK